MTDYLLGAIASMLTALLFRGFSIEEQLRNANRKLSYLAQREREHLRKDREQDEGSPNEK